jgi:hypothetical protein
MLMGHIGGGWTMPHIKQSRVVQHAVTKAGQVMHVTYPAIVYLPNPKHNKNRYQVRGTYVLMYCNWWHLVYTSVAINVTNSVLSSFLHVTILHWMLATVTHSVGFKMTKTATFIVSDMHTNGNHLISRLFQSALGNLISVQKAWTWVTLTSLESMLCLMSHYITVTWWIGNSDSIGISEDNSNEEFSCRPSSLIK